jgi:hypothetical protein
MNEQPLPPFIDLPDNPTVVSVTAYRVEYRKIPKWQFWRTEKVKVNLAVLTDTGRFFIVDPDNLTVEEKPNNY